MFLTIQLIANTLPGIKIYQHFYDLVTKEEINRIVLNYFAACCFLGRFSGFQGFIVTCNTAVPHYDNQIFTGPMCVNSEHVR